MSSAAFKAFPGFLFGCDPELFVIDPNGTPVCADGLIPGTKHEPYPVEYGAVQVDGMAAEFNIDPVDNYKDFSRNIRAVVKQLEAMLPSGYRLAALPSVVFSEEVFNQAPPHAKELGCMPDFNAWTGGKNPPPGAKAKTNPRMRTAAGHIHIGWQAPNSEVSSGHIANCNDLVQQLDWYLGAWSVGVDKDITRRTLYGQAGACRYKSYGVEYRVLSNFWVLDNDMRKAVWNRLQRAIFDMAPAFVEEKTSRKYSKYIQHVINTSDASKMPPLFQYPVLSLDSRVRAY